MEETLQALLWARLVQLKRVIIFLLSPCHGYLKNCAEAVAAVQIWLPKDVICKGELGLSCFFAGSLCISTPGSLDTSDFLCKLFPHRRHSVWPCKCGSRQHSCCGLNCTYYKCCYSSIEPKEQKRSGHTFQMAVFCGFPVYISNIRRLTIWSFHL